MDDAGIASAIVQLLLLSVRYSGWCTATVTATKKTVGQNIVNSVHRSLHYIRHQHWNTPPSIVVHQVHQIDSLIHSFIYVIDTQCCVCKTQSLWVKGIDRIRILRILKRADRINQNSTESTRGVKILSRIENSQKTFFRIGSCAHNYS